MTNKFAKRLADNNHAVRMRRERRRQEMWETITDVITLALLCGAIGILIVLMVVLPW